jgi:hypothetical protein
MEKQHVASAESSLLNMTRAPFLSGSLRFLRCGKDLGQFAEVLGGGGEQEFIVGATSAASSEASEAKNALEMGKQHLDLLSELHRDVVLAGLRDVAGNLSGILVLLTGDLACVGPGAALGFGRTDLTDIFQRSISGSAFAGRPSVRVRVVATKLF